MRVWNCVPGWSAKLVAVVASLLDPRFRPFVEHLSCSRTHRVEGGRSPRDELLLADAAKPVLTLLGFELSASWLACSATHAGWGLVGK